MSDTGRPTSTEIEKVFAASAAKRADYFVTRVALTDELWIIITDDAVLELRNEHGGWMIPVWPFKEFAEKYSKEACSELKRISIRSRSIDRFLLRVKEMISEGYSTIGVFPNTDTVKELDVDDFEALIIQERRRNTDYPDLKKL